MNHTDWLVKPSDTTPGSIVVHVYRPILTQEQALSLAKDITSEVEKQRTIKVTYNYGGSAEWTAVERSPGWWSIREWNSSPPKEAKWFWQDFTPVEKEKP